VVVEPRRIVGHRVPELAAETGDHDSGRPGARGHEQADGESSDGQCDEGEATCCSQRRQWQPLLGLRVDNVANLRDRNEMLSSNRRAAKLSTISVLLAVAGCPDPQTRYNEFATREPDAPVVVMIDAPVINTIPDISGTFLYSIFVSLFPQAAPLESIATVVVHMNTNPVTADIHIQWLTYTDHVPIDRLQADYPGQTVDN